VTSTLDGLSYTALELEAGTGDTAWEDLALLVKETLEELRILVVDILDASLLEAAVLLLFTIYRQRCEVAYFC